MEQAFDLVAIFEIHACVLPRLEFLCRCFCCSSSATRPFQKSYSILPTLSVTHQNALSAHSERWDPCLAFHIVIDILGLGRDLWQDLYPTRSTPNQGNSLSFRSKFGVEVSAVHQMSLEFAQARNIWHLPLVQSACGREKHIGGVNEGLFPNPLVSIEKHHFD